MELLGRNVTVAGFEQQTCQGDTLPCGPQICRAEAFECSCCSGRHLHVTNIGGFMTKPNRNDATGGCGLQAFDRDAHHPQTRARLPDV